VEITKAYEACVQLLRANDQRCSRWHGRLTPLALSIVRNGCGRLTDPEAMASFEKYGNPDNRRGTRPNQPPHGDETPIAC